MLEWMGRVFGLRKVSTERQPEIRHVRIGNVTAGVNIHAPEELLKISTVWRCVQLVSNATATLPCDVIQIDSTGGRSRRPNHDIAELLSETPNPEMTAFSFRRTLMHHKLLYGNGYAEVERDAMGRAVALWPIAPDRVTACRDEMGALFYRIAQPRGGFVDLGPRDIFHVPGLAWDGVRGYSVLEVGLNSLGANYAMDRFASRYFGHGMQPSAVITVPEGVDLGEDGVERLRKEVSDLHTGWSKAQGALILDQGMGYQGTTTDPDKGQFIETRKFTVFEACRWFGVPPYLAFASDEEPRANVETQSREFLMYGLDEHIEAFEQEANRKLFEGYRGRLRVKMNRNEFARGDLATRAAFYKEMRAMGAYTINNILDAEDMDRIGGEGDVRVMQVQYQPIGPDGAPRAIPTTPKSETPDGPPEETPPEKPNGAMNGARH